MVFPYRAQPGKGAGCEGERPGDSDGDEAGVGILLPSLPVHLRQAAVRLGGGGSVMKAWKWSHHAGSPPGLGCQVLGDWESLMAEVWL